MPSSVNLADLGRRVRAARIARRLTLEEVVARANFTVSWLSKLENGQLTPSLEGLVRLADVLECGVEHLVGGLSVPPRFVVSRKGDGRLDQPRSGRQGAIAEFLAEEWRERAMDPTILHLAGDGTRSKPETHDGERFLHVLAGTVTVSYGDDRIELAAGDSLYIDAAVPHTIVPVARGKAQVLSVRYESGSSRPTSARSRQRAPKA
jgi:transcriptional regulator with XRE-family HTH domain